MNRRLVALLFPLVIAAATPAPSPDRWLIVQNHRIPVRVTSENTLVTCDGMAFEQPPGARLLVAGHPVCAGLGPGMTLDSGHVPDVRTTRAPAPRGSGG